MKLEAVNRSCTEMLLWLVACAAVICARVPTLLDGRFWAEDGQVFYANAWAMPWAHALLYNHSGYINFIANAAGLLARLTSVSGAPLVVELVALLVQLLPCIVLIRSQERWLRSRVILAIALFLVVAPIGFEELWLNAANSQFHLILASCLALCLAFQHTIFDKSIRYGCVILAVLSSPISIVIVPIAILRAIATGDRRYYYVLFACVIPLSIQLASIWHSDTQRHILLHPLELLAAIYIKHLLVPAMGQAAAGQSTVILNTINQGHLPIRVIAGDVALMLAQSWCVAITWKERNFGSASWLILAGWLVVGLTYPAAIGGPRSLIDVIGGQRYCFAPQILFALGFLSAAAAAYASPLARSVAAAAVGGIVLMSVVQYRKPVCDICTFGPDWQKEVSTWTTDSRHVLKIWPEGWTMKLPQEAWPSLSR